MIAYAIYKEGIIRSDTKEQAIRESYPFINREDEISGYIYSNEKTYHLNHTNLITLRDGKRFRLTASGYNYNYSPSQLQEFITIRDSIYKPAYSDSIYIYRNSKRYNFILKNTHNKKELD